MSRSIVVIGSTGLIGSQFLRDLSKADFSAVTAITRREIPELKEKPFIRQVLHDLKDLETLRTDLQADILVSALGTTIKKAGSQERFFQIDHDLPLGIARIAREEGCQSLILVSAIGADPASRIFYSRVKGQLEADLAELDFEQLHILRPSLLLGERSEKRSAEFLSKLFMKPLSPVIPWKYRAINAETLAATLLKLAHSRQSGFHIHEGRSLFSPN